jgi:CMP-N-acetylneuraminic acid synthetase
LVVALLSAVRFRRHRKKTFHSTPQKSQHPAPPPSAHLRLILREQKIFPAMRESCRVYIGTSSYKIQHLCLIIRSICRDW